MGAPVYYGYIDYTDEGVPFYVGQGNVLRVHCKKRKHNRKHGEVVRLHGQHREVELVTTDRQAALDWERVTIARLHTFVFDPLAGPLACNRTLGGDGARGERAQEALAALKAAANRPNVKARRSVISRALWSDPKWRAMVIAAQKEGQARPEVRAARKAIPRSAELKARMSVLQQKVWSRPGMVEKASEKALEVAWSPDVRARREAATAKRMAERPPKPMSARALRHAQAVEWLKANGPLY
jgi:hypothetical protein